MVLFRITRSGRELLDKVVRRRRERLAEILEELEDEDLAKLAGIFSKILAAIERAPGEPERDETSWER